MTVRLKSALAFASNLETFEAPRGVAPRTNPIRNAPPTGCTQVRPLFCTNLAREDQVSSLRARAFAAKQQLMLQIKLTRVPTVVTVCSGLAVSSTAHDRVYRSRGQMV